MAVEAELPPNNVEYIKIHTFQPNDNFDLDYLDNKRMHIEMLYIFLCIIYSTIF